MPRRIAYTPHRGFVSPGVRTGIAMATTGAILAIATVWLEDRQHLNFAVGLTIGIALMPWIMTMMPSHTRMLPQPGAICALVLGGGMLVALAGLYSGRLVPFGIGSSLALTALVVWIAATRRDPLLARR